MLTLCYDFHGALDMTRKKMHVVESNEEYLVEEQIHQQNCVEQVQESSDHQVITSNDEEGSTDCDNDDDADNDEGNLEFIPYSLQQKILNRHMR
jgi:hypothetical protein